MLLATANDQRDAPLGWSAAIPSVLQLSTPRNRSTCSNRWAILVFAVRVHWTEMLSMRMPGTLSALPGHFSSRLSSLERGTGSPTSHVLAPLLSLFSRSQLTGEGVRLELDKVIDSDSSSADGRLPISHLVLVGGDVLCASGWRFRSGLSGSVEAEDSALSFRGGRKRDCSAVVGPHSWAEGYCSSTLAKICLESLDLGRALFGAAGGEGSPGDTRAILLRLVDSLYFVVLFRRFHYLWQLVKVHFFSAALPGSDGFFVRIAVLQVFLGKPGLARQSRIT